MRDSTKDLAPRSRALEALDFRDGPVFEPSTGLLVGRSGHRYSWSRGTSTLASVTATGGTYTAPATLPGWELANSQLGINLGTSDILRSHVATGWLPQELTGELLFVERGARTGTAGGTLLALAGDDPTSGVRVYLDTTGTYYRFTYHNGTTSVAATLTSGQPTAGQLVRMRFAISASGVLTLRQSINSGAYTSATSSALALPAAWASGTRLRIGRRGSTQNPAALTLLSVLLAPGTLTDTQLDELW